MTNKYVNFFWKKFVEDGYEENICERKYAQMKRDGWFDNKSPSINFSQT